MSLFSLQFIGILNIQLHWYVIVPKRLCLIASSRWVLGRTIRIAVGAIVWLCVRKRERAKEWVSVLSYDEHQAHRKHAIASTKATTTKMYWQKKLNILLILIANIKGGFIYLFARHESIFSVIVIVRVSSHSWLFFHFLLWFFLFSAFNWQSIQQNGMTNEKAHIDFQAQLKFINSMSLVKRNVIDIVWEKDRKRKKMKRICKHQTFNVYENLWNYLIILMILYALLPFRMHVCLQKINRTLNISTLTLQ